MWRTPDTAVLNKIYLIISLLVLMAIVVATVLVNHARQQEYLYDQISNYHTPIIYYTDKLDTALQEIVPILQQVKVKEPGLLTEAIRNPIYSIKNYLNVIDDLEGETTDKVIEKARLRLQNEVNNLLDILRDLAMIQDGYADLPALVKSAQFRAQQFSRLHVNASKKFRHKLAEQENDNTTTLIQLTVVAIIIGGFLVVPILFSIREMINSTQRSEKQQRELKELAVKEQSRMTALLSAMNIGILFEDKQSRVEYINPAFKRMWALDEDKSLIGHSLDKFLNESQLRFAYPEHSSKYVLQILDTHEISKRCEINFSDGRILTQLSYPVMDDGKGILGRLWIYEDITHERQTAQQLLYLAEHDHLTGLFNRHRFQQHLTFMIDNCRRTGGKFALVYFDLDDFKYINDTFGHGFGDSVLLRTTSEVNTLVRDVEMFARLGGDEFAILTLLSPKDDLNALPERIITTISSIPFRFRGKSIRMTTSLGLALYPEHGDNDEDLVAHADAAMYQAKKKGKNTWAVYDPECNYSKLMIERMSWSRRIGLALEQDLLELHFQGIYKTANRELSHLEVLVRMRDPAEPTNLIMPGAFIPFAEKTAQIIEIDRCVLAKSIALLAQYPGLSALAVNISGRSFDEPSLPDYIREQLLSHNVDPARLIIELTETETISDIQDAQRFIEAIRKTGCRICLDDFGSGFSSFTYLKYLNIEILKIDGLFVRDLVNNHEDQVFVKAMVSIAQGLNKLIVAEFVENSETLELLGTLGVQFVQGYYFDRPTVKHEVFKQLQKVA